MPSSDLDLRPYGHPRALFAIVGPGLYGLAFVGLYVGRAIEATVQGQPVPFVGMDITIGALAMGLLMYPVAGWLMYAPRTNPADICVDRIDGAPALVLRQSSVLFRAVFVQIVVFTVMLGNLFLQVQRPDSLAQLNKPDEHDIPVLILMLLLTCGWQTGYFFFVALRRIRCGHIALTTRGIHLSDHATDTHIPWEAARLGLAHDPLYVLVTLIGPGATSTARVPRPWAIIDDRRRNDLHHARKRRTVVFARIDRRRFCIAPELLDAILDHYLRNPDARAELADPEALARRVDALRSFPAGARWRGYGPVSVPVLEPV